jgi:hypothetical protein
MLVSFTLGYSKAQTGFLEISQTTVMDLTPDQLVLFNQYTSDTNVLWYSLVDIGDLPTVQVNGELHIQHPQKACVAEFKAKWVEEFGQDSYYWYGEVPEPYDSTILYSECGEGTLNIIFDSTGYIGTLNIDEDHFRIESIGNGAHILITYHETSTGSFCGNEVDSMDTGFTIDTHFEYINSASTRDINHCPVRVLFLYTNTALVEWGSQDRLKKLALEGIMYTNQAYRNSRVFNLSLQFVGIEFLDWIEPNFLNDAMDELELMMSQGQVINDLRHQYYADLVFVYVVKSYGGAFGHVLTVDLDPEKAIALINAHDDKDPVRITFGHESAHLFGCRHKQNYSPPFPTFNRAHRYWSPGFWGPNSKKRLTLTHEGRDEQTGKNHELHRNAIQHYSNPDVNKHGKPTGEEFRNNAHQLREQACNVAGFMPEPTQSLNLHITGDKLGCPCDFVTLGAGYNVNEPGNYQFEWRTGSDGFNWGPVESSLPTFAVQLPCMPGQGVFVQLTLIPPSGPTVKTFTFVEAVPDPYPGAFCIRGASNIDLSAVNFKGEFKIFPNPTKNLLNIEFSNLNDHFGSNKIELIVFNSIGQIVHNQSAPFAESLISIPISSWHPGAYWLSINHSSPQMFVVAK